MYHIMYFLMAATSISLMVGLKETEGTMMAGDEGGVAAAAAPIVDDERGRGQCEAEGDRPIKAWRSDMSARAVAQ